MSKVHGIESFLSKLRNAQRVSIRVHAGPALRSFHAQVASRCPSAFGWVVEFGAGGRIRADTTVKVAAVPLKLDARGPLLDWCPEY
jgi:hypothetical protein